jgi:pimeloyl-ACP methyl ester carboxylesterase
MIPSIDVEVAAGSLGLPGFLALPPDATHVVVFAHGSGSSRFSARNVSVAEAFHGDGLATLLFDLLTEGESGDRARVFDTGLLARRLDAALAFVRAREDVGSLPVALFGASTGAAAAIEAAVADGRVSSVVSRGGRPDLAGGVLDRLSAPTLLIVGANDPDVRDLNRAALSRIRGEARLEVVPGAGHLFEEPGALERVSVLASGWIREHQ